MLLDPIPEHPARRWAFLDQAQRDAAYNNSAAVSGSAELVKARNAASAAYREGHRAALDLAYGPGPRQAWDLYPGDNVASPCLVFIHGGYWQMNGRESFACLAAGPVAHGWSVAMPGYDLAPDATLQQIRDQIFRALDFLAVEGPRHGVGGKLIVSGWSAGGHLAALALAHSAVAAGLAISGVYELAPLSDTYLNAKLQLTAAEIETLSPLRSAVIQKELMIAYGSREVPALAADARLFHAHRAAAHAPGALLPVAGADHFTILDELRRPDGVLTRAALTLGPHGADAGIESDARSS
jgi:arylformamidase